jgi:perosamine synthetase
MKVPFFVPWITDKDKTFILKSLDSRWLTNGPFLNKFETKFSKTLDCKYSIGCSSATHALHMCLKALGIKNGDEVIVPTLTFAATADVVQYCDAKLKLCDVDSETFNITPLEIEKNINSRTKAVIVVHYGGQACDMKEIISLSQKYNFDIIEDCAHSLGSMYMKKFCGTFSRAGCFSFYPTKIITTGEGGMVTTNEKLLNTKIKLLRSHNMTKNPRDRETEAIWKYDIPEMGYNYRLDEIRSSLGYSQLQRIKKINQLRLKIAKSYNHAIDNIPGLISPKISKDRNHIYHLYTIRVTDDYPLSRDELFSKLHKLGIGTSVQYTPLHQLTYLRQKFKESLFPNANLLYKQILSLPIFPTMSQKQVNYVIKALKS